MPLLKLLGVAVSCAVAMGALRTEGPAPVPANDFGFLQPWFRPDPEERDKLAQGGVVVRDLPASGREISVIATCPVAISADAFVRRVHGVGAARHGEIAAGRFGTRPSPADLAALFLDQGDIDRLMRCRPGECALNLSNAEMAALQRAFATNATESSAGGQQAFRSMVLDRVARYKFGGLDALPEYNDRRQAVRPVDVFTGLLRHSPYLASHVPEVSQELMRSGAGDTRDGDSFLHWSKVVINKKPVVIVNHIIVFRATPGPRVPMVLVTGKQVYASRYMNGALTVSMLFAGGDGSRNYLVHVDRSDLDELGGRFSGFKRSVFESRIKDEAIEALVALKERLERGD